MNPLKQLKTNFSRYKRDFYIGTIYSILNKVFDIAPPLLIGLAVDTVVEQKDSMLAQYGVKDKFNQIYIIGFLTLLIWVLESIFEFLLKVKWRTLAQNIQHDIRMKSYTHLQDLPMSFFENQSTGNLTTVINDDVNQLERFLDIGANEIIQVLTTVISIGTIFFFISPLIATLSFTPVPFILWGSFYFQRKIAPRYLLVRNESGILASMLTNNLAGMATIKSYVAQKFEKQRLLQQSQKYSAANNKAILISSSFSPLIRMIILCGFMFALIIGGIKTLEGELAVGAYSIMIFLVQRLLWPLTRLGDVFDLYQRAMASTNRIFDLLNTKIEIRDGDIELQRNDVKGIIKFDNVSFSYEKDYQVLRQLSFEVQQGHTVAFVGGTGSGKSTVLKLLLRFYDLDQGNIYIEDQDLTKLKQNNFRSFISYVPQETYLFHGTVRDNILYGSFNATEDDIIQAAKAAEAYDFITSLPNGFDTIVGERGQKLSGGQRQRLAIARALIKKPKIFLFDEATSAVDNETEAAIQRSINKITESTTTLIVAHRLSTVKHADMIHVIELGEIKESGTHEQLLEKNGIYASLWRVQTGIKLL